MSQDLSTDIYVPKNVLRNNIYRFDAC